LIKVLVVGKLNSIVNWTENTVDAFRLAGCQVDHFALNGETHLHSLYLKLQDKLYGNKSKIVTMNLYKKLRKYRPDLIVFVRTASTYLPDSIFQAATQAAQNATKVVWVGDMFNRAEGEFANHVDWVFCTDSAFIDVIKDYKLSSPASYLPLAVNPKMFHPMDIKRLNTLTYVANYTTGRGEIVSAIKKSVTLYGKGWSKLKNSPHKINAYRLPYSKLPEVYASCRAVLNVKNEINVINGLNQRSFEPFGCMTPVLSDAMGDMDKCFEVGKEVLVYNSIDELNELHDRLTSDASFANAIGQAGYKRVIAEHTYMHRAETILTQVGLR
jgi:spore maturation protein CgeB